MTAGAFAILALVQIIIRATVYKEIEARVNVALGMLRYLTSLPGPADVRAGRLHLGPHAVNDNRTVDRVKTITGADATIFQIVDGRPIRLATTIMKSDGLGRNVGTELAGAARKAFDGGKTFVGVTPVAGRPFITSYELLCDADQEPIGLLYCGFPLTTMYDAQMSIMRVVAFSSLSGLMLCLGAMWLIVQPLRRAFHNAVNVANGLAQGDVVQETGDLSRDEVGDFNAAFDQMIRYQQRMAAVADAIADGDMTVQIAPVSSSDRLGIAFCRMLTNMRATVDQLGSLAMTDGLTQVGNLRSFREAIRIEMVRAARFQHTVSLALVDIDNFKEINDKNGHQHGDDVLVRLAALLRTLRAHDCAYRIGGDEFAIILPMTSVDDAQAALERLRQDAGRQLLGATLSIGLATSDGSVDAISLQRQADMALYTAKRRGRNGVVTFSDTVQWALGPLMTAQRMPDA